jgi:hypothetical protein
MKTETQEKTHRLFIQNGRFFKSNEWCLIDWVYWRSNTQPDRKWTCRISDIQNGTPLRRIETITDILKRLVERNIGFSKVPFGKPQLRKSGKGREHVESKQSFQYVFDAKRFDAWLKSNPEKPIRKRIDPYPKTDSQLSESGQETYPKADTKRMNEEREKKEPKEAVCLSQPPERAVAPVIGEDMAEAFESLFRAGSTSLV